MKINWNVRWKKKSFWLTIIPALLVLVQLVAGWFGVNVAAEAIGAEATKFINSAFVVLAILGIVVDPTTGGVGDSTQALRYNKPKKEVK